MVNNLAHR